LTNLYKSDLVHEDGIELKRLAYVNIDNKSNLYSSADGVSLTL